MDVVEYSDTGKQILEFLQEAKNYNAYLERCLLKFIGLDKKVADFGAGGGEFAGRLCKQGVDVTCIEVDPDLVAHLEKNNHTVVNNIEKISDYDCIYSLNVLEHIEDDVAALRSIYQALKPGGRFFLYVPAFNLLYTDVDKAVGHFRRYRRNELVKKCKESGFEVHEARYVDSLGFFCWCLLKFMPSKSGSLNPMAVKLYDQIVFPISRFLDVFFKKKLGKNLLLILKK